MSSERRHSQRIDVSLPVTLRLGGRLLPATALNISSGGMCLRSTEKIIVSDSPVEVIFDLDQEKRDIAMMGKITRVTSEGKEATLGVQFTNLFSLNRKAIDEYLGKHLH